MTNLSAEQHPEFITLFYSISVRKFDLSYAANKLIR